MRKKQGGLVLTLATIVSLAYIVLPSSALEKQAPEAKVAVVNGSVITQGDFDKEMNGVQGRLASMGKTLDDSQLQTLRMEVFESLINRELLYQESQNNGIKVEEAAINEQLNALKKNFSNEDDFKNALLNMDLSEADLKSQISRDLAIKQLMDKQFTEKTTASDKEAKSYYDSHPDDFKKPEQIKASHILVNIDPQADESHKAATRKKIEEIQQKMKKGEDFAALAKEFSQCPSNASGGDLGYFERGQMVKPFEDAAFALAPGETSSIVETKFGYHLIKSMDKKSETTFAYKDIKEELQQYLKQKKVQEQVSAYTEELKRKAKLERFITKNP